MGSVTTNRAIDPDAVVRAALSLIAARSMSGDEGAAVAVLTEMMLDLGAKIEVDKFGSVIGTWDFGPGPTILFETHIDTVPVSDAESWTRDPAGELIDGVVYGRGAVDMKGPLAACLEAVSSLRDSHRLGRVVISGSVAEELVEGPALLSVLELVHPDAVVICEPSRARVAIGQRGRAEVTVEAHGRSSHSAYPEAGRNAVEAAADLLTALRSLELPTHPTLGPALLVVIDIASRPYPSLSVVPDRCTVSFDRRTLPGESLSDVLDPIRLLADRIGLEHDVRFEIHAAVDDLITYGGGRLYAENFAPAWMVASDSEFVSAAMAGLRGADVVTEISHYAFCTNGSGSAGTLGIPTIGFGPGREDAAHTTDESITVDALVEGARGYAGLIGALTALSVEQIKSTVVEFTRPPAN